MGTHETVSGLTLVSSEYETTASLTQVWPTGSSSSFEARVPDADLSHIAAEIRTAELLVRLAWVDFYKRAVVSMLHPADDRTPKVPYGLPDFPEETFYGRKIDLGETQLVTDRDGKELEFTPLSTVISSGKLTPYTRRWFKLVAGSNYSPSFQHKLEPLLDIR